MWRIGWPGAKFATGWPTNNQPEVRFAALMAAIEAAKALATLYRNWRARLETSPGGAE